MTTNALREFLTKKLAVDRPTMLNNEAVYLGTSPLAFLDPATLKALNNRVKVLPINLARTAVDEVALRCRVSGFRSSPGDVVDDALLDLWRSLRLAESSELAQVDALTFGRSYFLVWADAAGNPTVTAESPLQFAVHRDPVTRQIVGALKRYRDDEGFTRSLVLTAESIDEYVTRDANAPDPAYTQEPTIMGEDMVLASTQPNLLGRVPVVGLINRPRLTAPEGESELSDLEAPVRAISKLATDMMVSSEYAAVPRRYITTDLTVTSDQAEEVSKAAHAGLAKPAASHMSVYGGGAKVGQFDTAELAGFKVGIELLVDQVACMSSLPSYFVRGGMANPTSADAIRADWARLTAKARQRHSWWGPSYADLMRLVALIRDGQEDPRLDRLETLWVDPEPSTVAQTADAVTKTYAAGIVDQRAALVELGESPLEIERIMSATPNGATQ